MKNNRAFTLIEIIVTIAIITVLASIFLISLDDSKTRTEIMRLKTFDSGVRNQMVDYNVSAWTFNGSTSAGSSATNNDVKDLWGINNGDVTGHLPTIMEGDDCVDGKCLDFNGLSSMVEFENGDTLSMGIGDYTISFWVWFDNATAPEVETIVSCGARTETEDGYWLVRYTTTDQLALYFSDGISLVSGYVSHDSINGGAWHHIVLIFDRDYGAYAYVDSEEQTAEVLDISPSSGNVQNANPFTLGAYIVGGTGYWLLDGRMDDVFLFNEALASEDVRSYYLAGLNSLYLKNIISKGEYNERLLEL